MIEYELDLIILNKYDNIKDIKTEILELIFNNYNVTNIQKMEVDKFTTQIQFNGELKNA